MALPSPQLLGAWISSTGEHPAIVQFYAPIDGPFPVTAVQTISQNGAVPLIQLNPRQMSLADLVRGRYDRQLRADRAAIQALGQRVLLSFGHEMNGTWYSWGCRHTSADVFRAAWRHVYDLVNTPQVTWVWTVSSIPSGQLCGLADWYPGSQYVDWIGVDGYLRTPSETFSSIFSNIVAEVRGIAPGKPVLITETGVPAGPSWAVRIDSLYLGARQAHLLGIVYFDGATFLGDYRPQDNRAELRAFRRAIRLS